MKQSTQQNSPIYTVCVLNILEEGWVRALELEPIATYRHYSGPPRTILELQLSDQAELLGLLNRLHNMNLTVLSFELKQQEDRSQRQSHAWDEI